MKKIVLLVLASISLVSCGGDKKKKANDATADQEVVAKGNFSVDINGIYKKDDTIIFYYTQNGFECTDERAIKQAVVGSDLAQHIIFKLPAEVILENFRINLSNNSGQETVILNAFTIKRNDKSFDIQQVEFSKYLNFNENVSWDDTLKGFKFLSSKDGYIPRVLGNQELESKLTEL